MIRQTLTGPWFFRRCGEEEWLPARVPGGVHTDLLALGRIPDPFVGDNEKRVQWIAESDWEYRLTFSAAATAGEERCFLVCDGLDTLAELWLNGRRLGQADNMFRRWAFAVTGLLQEGENELRVLFRAPVVYTRARQAEKKLTYGGAIPGGPHLRKAPCQWGWDWGPNLPPIGIWKEIRLEGYSQARLDDVRVRQRHVDGRVTVTVQSTVEAWDQPAPSSGASAGAGLLAGATAVVATLVAPDNTAVTAEAPVAGGQSTALLEVPDPQLWWPNGYGAQPLYRLEVALLAGGTVLDRRTYQVGLRTVELRRQPDEWGESFTFVVNGVPLFAKGADWIPADSFPTRLTDTHLQGLLQSAAAVHMNMLRVWGGGLYEEDRFYDLCDRYGLLVWQDFIFACGTYPDDEAFAENVRIEAVENVRRLRHHASLALWCGNNEMEQGWVEWKWNQSVDPATQRLQAAYDRLFHHLLPAVVAAEDPDRPYWPSSPSSGIPFAEPNSPLRGDMHYWEVWHGRRPFTAYRDQFPRFMSEFGFQSLPPYRTIQAYAVPEEQNMTSYVMEHHQRSGSGNGLIVAQMTDSFRLPRDFPALVYLSMVLQAEGIRYGVEHWRRNRQRVSGTLYWQLNDCWPVASWSSLDYFGRWKALHYAARRFYAPVLLSAEDQGTRVDLHVTSDLVQPWAGTVRWRLESLSGEKLLSGEQAVAVAPLSDRLALSLDLAAHLSDDNCRHTVLIGELWQEIGRVSLLVVPFCPNKHLELKDPGLQVEVGLEGERLVFTVTAGTLARFVELSLDGVDSVFSDNYFDVPAGTSVRVWAALPAGWTLDRAREAVRAVSLIDSY